MGDNMNEPFRRLETLQLVRLETEGLPTLGDLTDFVAACNGHPRDSTIQIVPREDLINTTDMWQLTLQGKGGIA